MELDVTKPDPAVFADLVVALEELEGYQRENAIEFYEPYPKQLDFHELSLTKRERLFMAGNQLGKTWAGACELSYHLTGLYPDWWLGRRFNHPVVALAGSKTAELTRDGVQTLLVGAPEDEEEWGTGTIPKACIMKRTRRQGVANALDSLAVKHVSGKNSVVLFKSYDQGREKWQAKTVHIVWFDEEPPYDVYSEGLTRITATKGIVFVTFTPLQGRSDVVLRYTDEPSSDRSVTNMTIEEVRHISAEEAARVIAGYPEHEREARAMGVPMLGSGRIFPYPESTLKEPYHDPWPSHWYYLWSIDFGGADHPFGAVLNGWDRDADVVHVMAEVRLKGRPIDHAAAMKPFGANIPVAWPQDGTGRESDGEPLAMKYKAHGLKMLDEHATWADGGLSTEAGIVDMQERMTTNRYKVADTLTMWFEEYREYHRKMNRAGTKSEIVKIRDDLMSASRIGIMMLRFAKPLALINNRTGQGTRMQVARDLDFDVLG
jgi:phage terminase large subunit-like protein